MTIKVLIVDDSRFICNRICEILKQEQDFKVVGIALNGKQGLQMAIQLKPDVITMDIEMPVMDGISAVKHIMAECPTAILMLSSMTYAGAQATLDALSAGAIDFLPKQLNKIDGNKDVAKQLLRHRVRTVALQSKRIKLKPHQKVAAPKFSHLATSFISVKESCNRKLELLILVASTGGPVAIQQVLSQLPGHCSFPILIVQHMPSNFTKSFAERLNQLCAVSVKEAAYGDYLKPGQALLGPGGKQMELVQTSGKKNIRITDKQEEDIYSPCADKTLLSVANMYEENVLTVVLTGMGSDGKKGVEALKKKGFPIWAQDEASCTIYGMPKAIVDANLADKVYSLDDISTEFKKLK